MSPTARRFELNNPRFFERCVCSIFLDGFKAAGRDIERYPFIEFWYKNTLLLHIGVIPAFAAGVVLRRARAVAQCAAHEGFFLGYGAKVHRRVWYHTFCNSANLAPKFPAHQHSAPLGLVFMQLDIVFSIAILVMSVVVHEVSHGLVANALGDSTARLAGRLSFNPLRHLDLLGSIFVPLFLLLSHAGIVFGWAKPVPVNPYNLRGTYGEALVSGAGPASNLCIAFVFGILIRFFGAVLPVSFVTVSASVVFINILLALFNLVPIAPLDGSKILLAFLPPQSSFAVFWEKYSLVLLLFFVFFLWQFLSPVVSLLFQLFTGIAA